MKTGSSSPDEVGARGAPAVIITSSPLEEADRITGLELGADDYLTKPYPFRELLVRIRAVAKPTRAASPLGRTGVAHFGRWQFDESSHRLVDAESREITPTGAETALLRVFLLETSGADQPVIETVRGVGYRFAYDVRWDSAA